MLLPARPVDIEPGFAMLGTQSLETVLEFADLFPPPSPAAHFRDQRPDLALQLVFPFDQLLSSWSL